MARCDYMVDYVARQKVGGTHINYFYLKQFPVLPPNDSSRQLGLRAGQSLLDWTFPALSN